ncbi:DUF2478 domain-containing protein [Rhodopseudomonas palustris]|uniref:DUF2478 domain-containing protein n=1 Tax=Rhodopseudomonas palustris (strain BisB18) TaxID=316056 RepID=Q20Y22_RHOPB
MFRVNRISATPKILAIVYTDGGVASPYIAELGYRLREVGTSVAGIVQYKSSLPRPSRCAIEVEELSSRFVLQLSEDEADQPFGCRIDPEALAEAAALIAAALRKNPDVVILNKFGRLEAEGGGLREIIAEAILLGTPLIAGVPRRNLAPWRAFTKGLAEEISIGSTRLYQWLAAHRMILDCEIAVAPAMPTIRATG